MGGKENEDPMDLTRDYPRSAKEKLAGLVMLARTTDKARAHNAGKLGEYHYNCPLDQAVFGFLGSDADEYARKAAELDDAQLETWLKQQYTGKKSAADIKKWVPIGTVA